jgi:hypothetical protein
VREVLVAINIGTSAGTRSPASECQRQDLAEIGWKGAVAHGGGVLPKVLRWPNTRRRDARD